MTDYLIRATAAGGQIRAFAATTRDLVEEARKAHQTWPVATAALGRLLTGAVMMGSDMKDEKDLLTINVRGDGPLEGMTVTADSLGHVKGYAINPCVDLPPSPLGKLDVGRAVGNGYLNVIKDIGLKDPYVGTIGLVSGEIAEDLTQYYAVSEQTPSAVGLGVLMNKDNTVACAGGFIVQLMPGAEEETISKLEQAIGRIKPVTTMLSEGMKPKDILKELLGDQNLEINSTMEVSFQCNCSTERISKALISLGKKELKDIVDEGKPVEIKCQFCNKSYEFSIPELEELLLTQE
ncbi:MAG: Hsp33 family molecular chaperone HslO [Lachnospiraceae bacterium]|nr:Hsp33 family molecular chaperone HslO [Lachnospiraceae bacterium]